MINGVVAAVMDKLKILNLIRHTWFSNAAENCSNPEKNGLFPLYVLKAVSAVLWVCLQARQRYHPRCAFKCSVPNKKNDCCGCLQNARCAVARLESSAHPATAESGTDSDRGGPVLLQTAFHAPLDLLPAKRRSVSIASLNFYLSSWIISLAVPLSPPLFSPSSASSVYLIWKHLCKDVWAASSAADGERGLPDEVSWGTRAAICPDKQMHSAPGMLCLQLVPPINAICVWHSALLSLWRKGKSPWRGNASEHVQFCCHGITMELAQQNTHIV